MNFSKTKNVKLLAMRIRSILALAIDIVLPGKLKNDEYIL